MPAAGGTIHCATCTRDEAQPSTTVFRIMTPSSTPQIVTTPQALADHIAALRSAGRFAFDTEFVGEDRYKPELCLVQTATDEAQVLIDPLAGVDCRPFWELVADPALEKIVHAGSEDLAMCPLQVGRPAINVFDQQIAAGLVGLGYPTNLARLTRLATGEKMHKSQTLTDWRRRPLTQEQVDYAIQDVVYLPAVRRFLGKKLEALGRSRWVIEECDALCRTTADQSANPVQIRRLKGMGTLTGREMAIAEALLNVRDQLAKELDRPPRTVLRDHLLVEIARRGWTDPGRIASLRGLNLAMSSIKRVAAAVEIGRNVPAAENSAAVEGDSPEEEVVFSLLTAVLRDYCNANELAYSLVATKENIRELVRATTHAKATSNDPALLRGWRKEAVGGLLTALLAGKTSIRVAAVGKSFRLSIEEGPNG